jgi:hypothetical protein
MVTYRSDLGYRPDEVIYDDACDVGLAVTGRTGTYWFHLDHLERDRHGDVYEWVYLPIPEHRDRTGEVRLVVLND